VVTAILGPAAAHLPIFSFSSRKDASDRECVEISYNQNSHPHHMFASFSQKIDSQLPKVCDVGSVFRDA
jgi:hypothetical protein